MSYYMGIQHPNFRRPAWLTDSIPMSEPEVLPAQPRKKQASSRKAPENKSTPQTRTTKQSAKKVKDKGKSEHEFAVPLLPVRPPPQKVLSSTRFYSSVKHFCVDNKIKPPVIACAGPDILALSGRSEGVEAGSLPMDVDLPESAFVPLVKEKELDWVVDLFGEVDVEEGEVEEGDEEDGWGSEENQEWDAMFEEMKVVIPPSPARKEASVPHQLVRVVKPTQRQAPIPTVQEVQQPVQDSRFLPGAMSKHLPTAAPPPPQQTNDPRLPHGMTRPTRPLPSRRPVQYNQHTSSATDNHPRNNPSSTNNTQRSTYDQRLLYAGNIPPPLPPTIDGYPFDARHVPGARPHPDSRTPSPLPSPTYHAGLGFDPRFLPRMMPTATAFSTPDPCRNTPPPYQQQPSNTHYHAPSQRQYKALPARHKMQFQARVLSIPVGGPGMQRAPGMGMGMGMKRRYEEERYGHGYGYEGAQERMKRGRFVY